MKDVTTMVLGHKIFSFFMIAFTIAYLSLISQIPIKRTAELAFGGGPRIFPLIISCLLLILLLIDYLSSMLRAKKNMAYYEIDQDYKNQEVPKDKASESNDLKTGKMTFSLNSIASNQGFISIMLAFAIVLYQFLIGYIGFIASTVLFLLALFRIFGVKNWLIAVLISLVFSILFYLTFELLFGVRLNYMKF